MRNGSGKNSKKPGITLPEFSAVQANGFPTGGKKLKIFSVQSVNGSEKDSATPGIL